MERKVELIKVKKQDAQAIRDMMCRIYDDEIKKWFEGKEEELYIPGYNSIEMQQYHTWDGKYYKIMYNGEMAGVILVSTTGREHGRIDRFYISPEFQGKGIGSDAVKLVEEFFPAVKMWSLDTTQLSKRNHHFYEKNGYKLISEDESERYYCKTIDSVDYNKDNYHAELDYHAHNFRDSNFAETDWFDLNMWGSTFSNSNLGNTIFQNTNLEHARFTNANLSNVVFGDLRMNNVELCHANLSNAYIHDINRNLKRDTNITFERCELENSTIRQCNLKNVKLEGCNLEGTTIDGINVEELLACYKKEHK